MISILMPSDASRERIGFRAEFPAHSLRTEKIPCAREKIPCALA